LITHTLEDYERRALELARNPEFLEGLRARLAQGRRGPLFDTKRFCRELERAFFTMQERALGGGTVG
jgi:predicted O-linked N-acetylglucosamine transferase (SPINDLY family)